MNHRALPVVLTAVLAVAGAVVAQRSPVEADLSAGDRPVLVPIPPCRLTDTRPSPNTVGPRVGALGPRETVEIVAHGENGRCDLPTDALALSLNVTALGATDLSFLTFWPDGERPLAASLNPAPGQPPVPNAVTTSLGPDGAFRVYNEAGAVDVVIDVNGYFAHHDHDDRYDTSDVVDAKIADATAGIPGAGTSYTKTESDARYYERSAVDAAISDATNGLLTADNVYTKTQSDSRYPAADDVYTKTESDSRYPATDDVYTKTESDDRFYEGDNVVLVPADGTPAENGAAFTSALAAIADASADNPYLIRLAAGVFDVGAGGVAMIDHVSIAGAGVGATVITSTGVPDSFRAEDATILLADGVTLSDLTIRNTGGASTDARALLGSGAGFLVDSVRLDVIANGSDMASGFEGADLSGAFDFHGVLRHVDVHVTAGSAPPATRGGGFGNDSGSGDMSALTIENSSVRLDVSGVGIGHLQGNCCSSMLTVRDTTVRLTAGGTGAVTTAYDDAIYDGVHLDVSGGASTNYGMFGAGSGFRPEFSNGSIAVTGSGATGIRYNNGFPRVLNTTIDASSVAIDANAGTTSSFSGTATIENSVIDAPTAFRSTTGTGTQRFRIGGTLIDANTLVDLVAGSVDARCADVHTDDHETVSDDCSGIAADPAGERTVLVTGGGSASENGAALVDAVAMVVAASPSDGDEWTIRLEPGTFSVTSTLALPSHIRLEGTGMDETVVSCSTCTLFTATGPVTLADLEMISATISRIADFQGGARIERVRVDMTGSTASPDGIRLDGPSATVLDSTIRMPAAYINQIAIESRVDELAVDGLVTEGRRPGLEVKEGAATIINSHLVRLGVESGTTVEVRDTVIDATEAFEGGGSLVAVNGGGSLTVTGVQIIGRSSSPVSMSGGTVVIDHSTVERTVTSAFPVIATVDGSLTLLHSSVNDNVFGTTETCFATVRTDTGTFLPDTCP